MAQNKKKVVVYTDWLKNFEDLTNEELGVLMRHFFEYINDMNPILEDRLLKIAWNPIEATLKRDLKKWEEFIDKQRDNGSKGGRPNKPKKPKPFSKNPNKAKKADSVSVNDNVSDIFNKWIEYREKIKKPITDASMKNVIETFNKTPLKKLEYVVNLSIMNGWQGLFFDKYVEPKQTETTIKYKDL